MIDGEIAESELPKLDDEDDSGLEVGENEVDDAENTTATEGDEPLPIETVAVMEKDVQIGEATFELFKDVDEEGKEFYYLVLPINGKMSGFLANLEGDLVDEEGKIMTSLDDLNEMLQDENFDEFEESKTGLLIMEIELAEIVEGPEELEDSVDACHQSCGRIDGYVH